MISELLRYLDKFQEKKVIIKLTNGRKMKCIPKHFIEPDEEEFTYLVETFESYGGYPKDSLYELSSGEIKEIQPI